MGVKNCWVMGTCRHVEVREEQGNLFNYLGNIVSYEGELHIDNKLNNFLKIIGILNNVFRPQKPLRRQE